MFIIIIYLIYGCYYYLMVLMEKMARAWLTTLIYTQNSPNQEIVSKSVQKNIEKKTKKWIKIEENNFL